MWYQSNLLASGEGGWLEIEFNHVANESISSEIPVETLDIKAQGSFLDDEHIESGWQTLISQEGTEALHLERS